MTETMIDRLVIALADEFKRQSEAYCGYADVGKGDVATLDGSFDLRDAVKVVLGELREPTGAMLAAGYGNTKGDPDHTGCADNPLPDDSWPRMIDAALEEG